MTRPRDNQRSRLHAAEWECFGWTNMQFKDFAATEAYLRRVLSNRYVQRKYQIARDIQSGIIPLKISKGDGSRVAWTRILPDKMWISIPRKWRNDFTVIHQVAHLLTPPDVQEHGREFCRTYLHLVLLVMGREKQKQFKAGMKKHKCKYSRKHTPYKNPLSREEKEVMLARLLRNNHDKKRKTP